MYQIKRWDNNEVIFEFGETVKECLVEGIKRKISFFRANLRRVDLSRVDLSGVDLRRVDLRGANLSGANLRGANLSGANLIRANLIRANLRGADLDFSCWPLWCGSLKIKTDEKQRIQIAFHWASLVVNVDNATAEEKLFVGNMLEYLNRFHRSDVDRLVKPISDERK